MEAFYQSYVILQDVTPFIDRSGILIAPELKMKDSRPLFSFTMVPGTFMGFSYCC
jgi:hypothetical protein